MSNSNNCQTIARSSRMPSARAFHIFRLAEIQGQSHKQIAALYKVTRRRISQIVERVKTWLSQHPCEDPQIASELQAKRLGQHLEQMRLEDIIHRARQQLTDAKPTLDTVIDKADGTKTIICREQPFNVQVLKTYLRAVEALGRINARPEIPLPPPAEGEFPWLQTAINEVYEKWWDKIWSRKLKPELIHEFVNDIIIETLKSAKHQEELAARPLAEAVDPNSGSPRQVELPADLPPSDLDGRDIDDLEDALHSDSASAPLSSEYSVLSTPHSPQPPENLNPKSKVEYPESPSTPSLGEAPASDQADAPDDAATNSAVKTCAAASPPKTELPTAPPSQENPKREAPPSTGQIGQESRRDSETLLAMTSAPTHLPTG